MKFHIKTKHNIARNCLTNYADRLVGIKLALMSARKRKNKSIKQSIRNNTKHHNIADF